MKHITHDIHDVSDKNAKHMKKIKDALMVMAPQLGVIEAELMSSAV